MTDFQTNLNFQPLNPYKAYKETRKTREAKPWVSCFYPSLEGWRVLAFGRTIRLFCNTLAVHKEKRIQMLSLSYRDRHKSSSSASPFYCRAVTEGISIISCISLFPHNSLYPCHSPPEGPRCLLFSLGRYHLERCIWTPLLDDKLILSCSFSFCCSCSCSCRTLALASLAASASAAMALCSCSGSLASLLERGSRSASLPYSMSV